MVSCRYRYTDEFFDQTGSMLAQLVSTYDIVQDLQLLAAINALIGQAGSEFGGIDSGVPGKQLSTGLSLFAQLAWYF
jgi:hypothetical protein